MASNALFFGWNRSIPGRERISEQHFGEFVEYLTGLQQQGTIQSFDVTLLNPHGGDMNGFFLIRGESADLSAVMSSEEAVTSPSIRGVSSRVSPFRWYRCVKNPSATVISRLVPSPVNAMLVGERSKSGVRLTGVPPLEGTRNSSVCE